MSAGVEVLPPLRGHNRDITSVAFSPDGSQIISGSKDEMIRFWDVSTGVEMRALQGHSNRIYSVTFSPDGSKNVWGCGDVSTGAEILTRLPGHTIGKMAFSLDGSNMICRSAKIIRVWNTNTGIEIHPQLEHGSYFITAIAVSPDGSTIISVDTAIRVWDASTHVEMFPLQGRGSSGLLHSRLMIPNLPLDAVV